MKRPGPAKGPKRRLWIIAASLILVGMVVASIGLPRCRVSDKDFSFDYGDFKVIVAAEGYVLIMDMNITSRAPCEVHLSAIEVRISRIVYRDGTSADVSLSERESFLGAPIKPGETFGTAWKFEQYFERRPIALTVEITLHLEEGSVKVFQGELRIPLEA